jgi:phosphopantetheinyl transferase
MLRVAVAPTQYQPDVGDALAPGWMGEGERRRWAGLAPRARCEFVASRGLLRTLLRAHAGAPGGAWDVSAEAGTAPVARSASGLGDEPAVPASLSHRVGWVAAAVADARVGVDIECDRPARSDAAERAALMLAASEMSDWNALPDDRREPALLARWTAKEAWFKASPPGTAPWDFRRVVARACEPAQANVRVWAAPPLYVAVSCANAADLAGVDCDGLDPAATTSTFWHVAGAASAS